MANKIPSSWFEDDPEWELLRHKAEKRPVSKDLKQKVAAQHLKRRPRRDQPRAAVNKESTDDEVVVNLKLAVPRLKPPDLRKFYRQHKKHLLGAAGIAGFTLVLIGTFKAIDIYRTSHKTNKPASAEERATQSFNPLIPLENLKDAAGDQVEPEYAFDDEKKVLGYSTEYNGAVLTLSQQALPEKLKSNQGELALLAQSIGAGRTLDTQKGTAYISAGSKDKTQRAVFATDEVLVFIQASKVLDDDEWKFYINQLNPRD